MDSAAIVSPSKPRILVVDAQAGMAAWRRRLSGARAEVVAATSADKALAAAKKQNFALVLLDLEAMDPDGAELAGSLREQKGTREASLIFITAPRRRKPKMLNGADSALVDHIVKPVNDAALDAKLKIFLELHRNRQSLKIAQQQLSQQEAQYKAEVIQRKKVEELMLLQASHDVLTGLPNRLLYMDRLETALQRSAIDGRMFALAYVDLDDFKRVNDQYGHQAGDELLLQIAVRLRSVCRRSDTVARLGGDEFGVVLEDIASANEVLPLLERLRQEIARTYRLSFPGHHGTIHVQIGASVGASIFPAHARTVDDLIRAADMAMYKVKASGKNYCLMCGE